MSALINSVRASVLLMLIWAALAVPMSIPFVIAAMIGFVVMWKRQRD